MAGLRKHGDYILCALLSVKAQRTEKRYPDSPTIGHPIAMKTILTSIFSPRKTSEDREANSSPLGPKSALSSKKSRRRRSLPEPKMERSVRFQHILNDTDISPLSTKSPEKKTSAEESRAESSPRPNHAVGQGAEDGEHTFTRFAGYRWNGDSIEIEVEWEAGDATWEREDQLHQDAPDALLEYWESQGGRPVNPNNPDLFDIHAIRKHSKDRKKLLVEWVGYGPEDATWVPRAVVEETAPEEVARYWKTVQPARPKQRRRRRG